MPYRCGRCGHIINDMKDFESVPGMRCPMCGYRVFYKVRSPIVKRIRL
ncbi:MAG: DNA-directed RNA polymerase subunit P [Candidatus Methanomethylicia archaeon]